MFRLILSVIALLGLAGCAAEPVWAPDDQVEALRFVSGAPAEITLFTVINNRSGSGAHSGLLINGTQRVMFDPAGSWHHPRVPERNDVHFGITDRMTAFYIDYHARETFRVIEQRLLVPPEVAELVMRRAMSYGAVPKAHCTTSIASILRGVPGFERLPATWFPKKFSEAFGKLPGVKTRVITDDDADNNHGVLIVQASTDPA
ncbi:MAG: hypothetical protein HC844_17130 [Tabrizicola sp.]|nr:hypothetical protein [Tabrizicola sp.]